MSCSKNLLTNRLSMILLSLSGMGSIIHPNLLTMLILIIMSAYYAVKQS